MRPFEKNSYYFLCFNFSISTDKQDITEKVDLLNPCVIRTGEKSVFGNQHKKGLSIILKNTYKTDL